LIFISNGSIKSFKNNNYSWQSLET